MLKLLLYLGLGIVVGVLLFYAADRVFCGFNATSAQMCP